MFYLVDIHIIFRSAIVCKEKCNYSVVELLGAVLSALVALLGLLVWLLLLVLL